MLFDKTARVALMVHKSSVGGSVGAQGRGRQKEILLRFFEVGGMKSG